MQKLEANHWTYFSVPLFSPNRDVFGLRGTGLLCEFQEQPFLVTAAHVVDPRGESDGIFVLTPEHTIAQYTPDWLVSSMPTSGRRIDDPVDLGFSKMSREEAATFRELGFSFFPSDGIYCGSVSPSDSFFCVGFPNNRQILLHLGAASQATFRQVFLDTRMKTFEPPNADAPTLSGKLILEFNEDTLSRATKTPPCPPGMSGGPVFRYFKDRRTISLVGVLTGWGEDDGFLEATRSLALVCMLKIAMENR